jgi:hypothetical protein
MAGSSPAKTMSWRLGLSDSNLTWVVTKKLLFVWRVVAGARVPIRKSFLVLFFKKEHAFFLTAPNAPPPNAPGRKPQHANGQAQNASLHGEQSNGAAPTDIRRVPTANAPAPTQSAQVARAAAVAGQVHPAAAEQAPAEPRQPSTTAPATRQQ